MGASASLPCVNGAELHSPSVDFLAEPHVKTNGVRWKEPKSPSTNEVRGRLAARSNQRGAYMLTCDWVASIAAFGTFDSTAYQTLVCLEGVPLSAAVSADAGLAVVVFPMVYAMLAYESSTAFLCMGQ